VLAAAWRPRAAAGIELADELLNELGDELVMSE